MLRMDFVPLRDSREFRLLFASRSITLFGTNAGEVALLVQAKQLTGSAVAVGLLGIAELVPIVVFGLYGGLLADRFDRGRMLRWCEAGLGALAGALVLNASLPHPAVWPLYALAAGMSALAALQRPSFDAAVPRTVARERLSGASALLSMSSNAGQIIGAALGGAIAAGLARSSSTCWTPRRSRSRSGCSAGCARWRPRPPASTRQRRGCAPWSPGCTTPATART